MKFGTPLVVFAVLFGLLLTWPVSRPARNGPSRLYSVSCEGSASISLDLSVYRHMFYDELGGGVGWGLFYHPSPAIDVPLYDNGFSREDNHGLPGHYVAWHFDGRSFSGPYPSSTYAPLPVSEGASVEKIFDVNAVVGKSSAGGSPPFMNIFINPEVVPQSMFSLVANCLSTNHDAIDNALSGLGAYIPSAYSWTYRDLKLGGIVYGLPPYQDPNYVRSSERIRGSIAIPDSGSFTLYPGQTAEGRINDHLVQISLDSAGNANLKVDGTEVHAAPHPRTMLGNRGKTNVPGVSEGGSNWTIDGRSCIISPLHCGKMITAASQNDDRSFTYRVGRKLWDGNYQH